MQYNGNKQKCQKKNNSSTQRIPHTGRRCVSVCVCVREGWWMIGLHAASEPIKIPLRDQGQRSVSGWLTGECWRIVRDQWQQVGEQAMVHTASLFFLDWPVSVPYYAIGIWKPWRGYAFEQINKHLKTTITTTQTEQQWFIKSHSSYISMTSHSTSAK